VIYKCVAKGGKNFRKTRSSLPSKGDRVKRIDVYFRRDIRNGAFVKQPS